MPLRNDHVKECHNNEEDKVEEDTLTLSSDSDSECFIPPSCSNDAEGKAFIHYDIVLSSTYSVPVLYFSIKDAEHRFPPTQHVLYKHIIIPNGYEEQTKEGSVGVLGGVSVAVSCAPFLSFLHPSLPSLYLFNGTDEGRIRSVTTDTVRGISD